MAAPQLVTVRDFTTSRYSQLADNVEGPLADILARAEAAVQSQLQRSLLVQEYTERFWAGSQTLFLRRRPITSVLSVQRRPSVVGAWVELDPLRYDVQPEAGYLEVYDLVKGYQIEVVYEAGYSELPDDLKEAIIMQAVLFTFQDLEVYGSGDGREPGILYMERDIDRLLAPYRATGSVWN